jgi:hypothetical protein
MELEVTPQKPFFERNWVKYGLIGGAFSVGFTILLYLVDEQLLGNMWIGLIGSLIVLGIAIYAAIAQRHTNGGYITYSEVLGTSIGAFIVSFTISTIFTAILFILIDPSLQVILRNAEIKQLDDFLESGFINKEQYENGLKEIDNGGVARYIFNWSMVLIIGSIIGLIIFSISSIFIRREPQR